MKECLPISLDLRITGRCNLNCGFCFGASPCLEEIDAEKWLVLLDRFWERHVKCLVITGGEPTQFSGFIELLRYAKEKGFYIVLSSNGTSEDLPECFDLVNALSLPIDGKDYEQCARMRGITQDQYANIINNATLFKCKYSSKTLKIGTVITKENYKDIQEIYNNIFNLADVWKLYQVSWHKRNDNIFHDLMIGDEQFQHLSKKLVLHDTIITQVVFYNNSFDGKYLFCEPNGDAMVIINGQEQRLGSFITDFDMICGLWHDYVLPDALEQNIVNTYLYNCHT